MNVGVVGCGSIGARYARWLHALGARVFVHDQNADQLSGLADEPAIVRCESLRDLLLREVERVVVATPPSAHADVACAALEAGATVLVEKPIAASMADAARIVEAVQSSGRSAFVVCNMRFHDGPLALKQHIRRIGEPLFARAYFGHRLSQMRPAGTNVFASRTSEGGGVVLDCVHEFDYIQWLLGDIDSVDSRLARLGPDQIDAEDYADVRLLFRSGVHGLLQLDFLMRRKMRGAEIVGTEGNLAWCSRGRAPEECTVSFGDQRSEDLILQLPDVDPSLSYRRMLLAFLTDLAGLQTAMEGHRVLSMALKVRKACQ